MTDAAPAYGLWMLVVFNSAVFIMFAFSFFKPQTGRDWRTFSATRSAATRWPSPAPTRAFAIRNTSPSC